MNAAKTFSSITTANTGTSTISGSSVLTVSGNIKIDVNNILALNPSCNANSVSTQNLNSNDATISGGGTLTITNDISVFKASGSSNYANFVIGAGTTVICRSVVHGNGNNGDWSMTISGTFKVSGTLDLDIMTCNSGSTVEYNGASQNVWETNYYNLTLSGSGTKTFTTATTAIAGDFTLNGSVSTTAVTVLTISGNVGLSSGTAFTAGNFTHNVAGNWTNNGATFTPGTGTISLNGNTQTIGGTAVTTFKNLATVGNGTKNLGENTIVNGTLNLSNTAPIFIGTHTLTLYGTISGGGKLSGSSTSSLVIAGAVGTLNFDQTSASTRSLNDITFNSGSSATLGSALDVYGTVSLTTATFNLAGKNLTLRSNATATASVSNLTGSTLSGATNVTVERYLANPGHRSWHLLSAKAVTGSQTIYNAWQENGATGAALPGYGTLVTSNLYNGSNGFDMASNSASVLTYNQGGLSGPSWNYNLANTNSTVLSANNGYMLFVRGDRNYTPANGPATSATVLRTNGTLTQGTQSTITVSATGSGRTLVANPFASPVDFENIHSTTNLDQNFYVWDPTLTGNYGVGGFRLVERNANGTYQQTPVAGGSTTADASSRYIHSGQAVLLKATGSGAGVVFNENSKATAVSAVNPFTQGPADQQLFVNLMAGSPGTEATLGDGFRVRFNNVYSAATTDDVEKVANFGENLSSYRENIKMIVEKRPLIAKQDTIFLRMSGTGIKKYYLQVGTNDFIQTTLPAFVQDNYLGSKTAIDLSGGITNIGFNVTSNPASAATDRFMIVFGSKAPVIGNDPRLTNELVRETNATGPAKAVNTMNTTNTANTINAIATTVTADSKEINVYPNPVINRVINLQLNDLEKGNYFLQLYNNIGQVVFGKQLIHNGGKYTQIINLGHNFAKGNYRLVIIYPDGKRMARGLVVAE